MIGDNDDVMYLLYSVHFGYFRQAGGTGELINDIFGSSDEDDEDFEVSTEILRKNIHTHVSQRSILNDIHELREKVNVLCLESSSSLENSSSLESSSLESSSS